MNVQPKVWDIRGTDFLDNPEQQLTAMRNEGAVVRAKIPLMGPVWMTTTDSAARKLLKDSVNFSRDPVAAGRKPLDRMMWWMPRFMAPLMNNIIMSDGEKHKRLRKLVDHAFARTEIDDLRPQIARIAHDLLDELPTDRPVDLIATYTHKLPVLVICALLGIPDDHREKISGWIAPISGPTNGFTMLRALPGLRKIMNHFRADFETVRRTGRSGLIHELVCAEADGDRLNEDELLSMVFTLFVAGHETTVHLINDIILAMVDRPEIAPRIAQAPEEIQLLVEEAMRYFSPVMMTKPHFTVRDVTFEGVELARGDMITALLIGANHDEARFQDPQTFKQMRRPNAHLGFGFGPHICLGMQLARAEAQVAIEVLFQRFPDLQLAVSTDQIEWSKRTGMRGPKALPVRLMGKARLA